MIKRTAIRSLFDSCIQYCKSIAGRRNVLGNLDDDIKCCFKHTRAVPAFRFEWAPQEYGKTLIINEKKLSIDNISTAVKLLQDKAVQTLRKCLLDYRKEDNLDDALQEIVEDGSLEDGPSRFLGCDAAQTEFNKFLNYIELTLQLRSYAFYEDSNGALFFTDAFINQITELADQLLQLLLTLVHMTSGQPARAPELETYLIRRTTKRPRTVFFFQGMLMLQTIYRKSSQVTGFDMLVSRFLPKEISRLVLMYLVYVRPLLM
jgi:hypothetical protein